MPLFTIVTATRDRPDQLREALRSALAQAEVDFEHLVVDDASEHGSAEEVAAEFGDPRVRVIRLEESRGPAGARNAAVEQARGRYVAILDDDDLMLPDRLRRSAEHLDRHTDCVLVAGSFLAIDAGGNVQATVRPPTGEQRIRSILPHHNPFCHSTCAMRTEVLQGIGGYREDLRFSHDYDMVLRMAEQGAIAILDAPLGLYRFHTQNISTKRARLQGAFADIARECAQRRARGEPEELEELVRGMDVGEGSARKARARAHYQIGEWMFRDGRVKEARKHLHIALRAEPFRPLCLALTIAAWMPAFLRRILAPLARPVVAARYPSWR